VKGCKTPKARRPKQGNKELQKQPEKEMKAEENKKLDKRKQKIEEKTDLNPKWRKHILCKGWGGHKWIW
jgi:hypothetical protein